MAVTDADVKAVADVTRDTTPFLTVAQSFVNEQLLGKGLSSDRLDQITLYLAAHFVTLTDEKGGLRASRTGSAEEQYRTPTQGQEGLASTRFGQAAMMLDTTGTLASTAANNGLKARFQILAQPHWYYGEGPICV